jgi:hypothetical protein
MFKYLLWITNSRRTIDVNFQQDFMPSSHSDFFHRETDWGNYVGPTIMKRPGCPIRSRLVNTVGTTVLNFPFQLVFLA